MAGRDGKISCEIVETLAELDNGKMLRVVSWNGREAALDLRKWYEDRETGDEKPGKGISFSRSEASDIVAALSDYLEKEPSPKEKK